MLVPCSKPSSSFCFLKVTGWGGDVICAQFHIPPPSPTLLQPPSSLLLLTYPGLQLSPSVFSHLLSSKAAQTLHLTGCIQSAYFSLRSTVLTTFQS